jgi:hypothetical protein
MSLSVESDKAAADDSLLKLKKGRKGMKRLSLVAVGLAVALSVGAQTNEDKQQAPTQQDTGKAAAQGNVGVNPGRAVDQSVQPTEREQTRVNPQPGVNANEHEGARVQEQGGTVSHSTTVFRNGRESSEHLNLHRSVRERNDVHFGIGTHDRSWWLRTYSIVLMDGCHYYLADNGCWYPAYGFDPRCDYPAGAVYCE